MNDPACLRAIRPDIVNITQVVQSAIKKNIIGEHAPIVFFFDFNKLAAQVEELKQAFPRALNSVAVKAMPLVRLLKYVSASGLGAEVASLGELIIAEKAGFPPNKIVYDSPVKTRKDLISAIKKNIWINLDGAMDAERLLQSIPEKSDYKMGLRVNPGIGPGRIGATSTATAQSKFGISFKRTEQLIVEYPRLRDHLHGLHLHIGSQGFPLEMLVQAVKSMSDFAMKLNRHFGTEIGILDIGGGLPVHYRLDDPVVTFSEYSKMLNERIPDLSRFKIVTEFGRAVFAYSGWMVTQVENVKFTPWRPTALVHAGTDLFLRNGYMNWYHDMVVFDHSGEIKSGNEEQYDVGGPLCFSGDYIARERSLPQIEPGDWLVVRDAGAYTFSMWSSYNSRAFPPIFGYSGDMFEMLHPGINSNRIADFWSGF